MSQSQVVTIDEVREIPGKDRIECVKVLGWWVIVRKATYAVGSQAVFIFPDTVVTGHFAEAHGLKKLRVRAMKMAGIVSEGLIEDKPQHPDFNPDDTDGWFGFKKWEPPVCGLAWMKKGRVRPSNPDFPRHRDTDNIRKLISMWTDREVVATVKIHGMNIRFGWVNGEWMVGSRNVDLEVGKAGPAEQSLFERAAESFRERCPKDGNFVFVGELFGKGIQDLDYGIGEGNPAVAVFAVLEKNIYLGFDAARHLCDYNNVPFVPVVYRGKFNLDILEILASAKESDSYFPGVKHLREGVVVSDLDHFIPPMKLISPHYLTREGGSEWN